MNKYCVVIGDNPELSKQVQEALFNAGFKWALNEGENVFLYENSPLLILEIGTITCLLSNVDKQEFTGVTKYVTADFILQGGAMRLDGAKKVEARWFLEKRTSDIIKIGGVTAIVICALGNYCAELSSVTLNDCDNKNEFTELTAEAVAYITDNAEKAKELGYVFREWKSGDDIITYNGNVIKKPFGISCRFCAGYRYCKKAEAETVATAEVVIRYGSILGFANKAEAYCHNCAKPVTPADSNYCRHCRAKLEK